MSSKEIRESGMVFAFPEDDLFWIEQCPTVRAIGEGVKVVEMIVRQNNVLVFIEAKQSSPRPDNQQPFDIFIEEIYEKFRNSLLLFAAISLNREFKKTSHLPANITPGIIASAPIRFYLIVKGHRDEWIPPLDEALQLSLGGVQKCFGIASVKVINDVTAKKYKLIV